MLNKVCLRGLWVATPMALLLAAVQALSGHWIAFFLFWPGMTGLGRTFLHAMVIASNYHKIAGFTVGAMSILILIFAFLSKSSVYVRIFAVVGFIMTLLAASGGFLYVTSGFQNRWALGQMADAFVGMFGAYFIQLFFMNKTPKFPWNKRKSSS